MTLRDIAGLAKLRLSLSVGGAAAAGHVLATGEPDRLTAIIFLHVLALAAGAGCLNNCQDMHVDAAAKRTADRALPAGRITRATALALSLLLLATGSLGLYFGPFPPATAFVAVVAIALYNAIYTPMKKRTITALLPGVICGSLPPLIGWVGGNGTLDNPAAWSLMMVFGLWQPPHFWLVVLANSADYDKGGLPSMLSTFSRAQLSRILFTWTAMLGISMIVLPMSLCITRPTAYVLEGLNAALLIGIFGLRLLTVKGYRLLFATLNISVLAGISIVLAAKLLGQ